MIFTDPYITFFLGLYIGCFVGAAIAIIFDRGARSDEHRARPK